MQMFMVDKTISNTNPHSGCEPRLKRLIQFKRQVLRGGILWEAKRRTFTLSQAKVRSSNPSVREFGLASDVIEKPNEGFFSSLLITYLSTTSRSQAAEEATGIEGRD
jgi:hypothetical protein